MPHRRAPVFVPHRTPRFMWLKRLARAAPLPTASNPKQEEEEKDIDALLLGAVRLMQLALCPGMAVEVYVPNQGRRFWAARIERVAPDGFWCRFDDDDASPEALWCPRDGFLSCWRFPLADEADAGCHFTYRNVRRLLPTLRAPSRKPKAVL